MGRRFIFVAEEQFLTNVVRDVDPNIQFKLSPVYIIYMTGRYRISPHYRTGLNPNERAVQLAEFLQRVCDMLHVTIQV